jgi:hypothetical protein
MWSTQLLQFAQQHSSHAHKKQSLDVLIPCGRADMQALQLIIERSRCVLLASCFGCLSFTTFVFADAQIQHFLLQKVATQISTLNHRKCVANISGCARSASV